MVDCDWDHFGSSSLISTRQRSLCSGNWHHLGCHNFETSREPGGNLARNGKLLFRFSRAAFFGALFSLAFCLVLVPWTIRNQRVFHLFQPLAPAHAEMPGEFVPRGYLTWLRTWIDEGRYIGPVLWALDDAPIKVSDFPDRAFDSAEEKQRVATLLDKYNHPPEAQPLDNGNDQPQDSPSPGENQSETEEQAEPNVNNNANNDRDEANPGNQNDEDNASAGDEADEDDQADEDASATQTETQAVEMTPEIDAGFAQIAAERKARHPIRYYLFTFQARTLPLV